MHVPCFGNYCRIDLEQRDLSAKLAQVYYDFYIRKVPKNANYELRSLYAQLLSNIWQSRMSFKSSKIST